MYLPFPRSSSFVQSVSMQNSGPTRQISPVRLHTTVGVPLYEISLSSSCSCARHRDRQSNDRGSPGEGKETHDDGALEALFDEHLVLFRERHLQRNE